MAGTFAIDVSRFVAKAKLAPSVVVRKLTTDILTSVVLKTPVDAGRARANWNVSLNRVDTSVSVTTTDVGGQKTIHFGNAAISKWEPGDTIYIANSLPYIRRLEYDGWSKQAPAGMVRITLAQAQQFIKAAVASLPK